jgi:hypothetical protein
MTALGIDGKSLAAEVNAQVRRAVEAAMARA